MKFLFAFICGLVFVGFIAVVPILGLLASAYDSPWPLVGIPIWAALLFAIMNVHLVEE